MELHLIPNSLVSVRTLQPQNPRAWSYKDIKCSMNYFLRYYFILSEGGIYSGWGGGNLNCWKKYRVCHVYRYRQYITGYLPLYFERICHTNEVLKCVQQLKVLVWYIRVLELTLVMLSPTTSSVNLSTKFLHITLEQINLNS